MGIEEAAFLTPRVKPQGLVSWGEHTEDGTTPVLHLHGAVGWYEADGDVVWRGGDDPYNPTLGVPVILYPDPEKDPTRDSLVEDLWRELEKAIAGASHILVLGHSLNDPALLRTLQTAEPHVRVGITVFAQHEYFEETADEEVRGQVSRDAAHVEELIPGAVSIPTNFGPEPIFRGDEWIEWMTGDSRAEQ